MMLSIHAVWQSSAELAQLGHSISVAIEKYKLYSLAVDLSNKKILTSDWTSSVGLGQNGSSSRRLSGSPTGPELSASHRARAEAAAGDLKKLQGLLEDFTSASLQFRDLLRATEVETPASSGAYPSASSINGITDEVVSIGSACKVEAEPRDINTISPLVKVETFPDTSSRPSIVV
jgi:hypothetical protein